MVLEQLYSSEFLRKKPYFAFLLGICYSIVGIFVAMFAFPKDPALVAVAVTALLFLPSFYKMTFCVEESESKIKRMGVWHLIRHNQQLIKAYLAAFFGVFLVFTLFSMLLPSLAANHLFKQQLAVFYGAGGATFTKALFIDLLRNNILVLLLCFAISLLAGNGAIFLIAWNASVWGTIFGSIAKTASFSLGGNAWFFLLLILLTVLPHLLLEISSYVLAVISGTVISDGFAAKKLVPSRLAMLIKYNLILLVTAIVILLVAAGIETFVLGNFHTYTNLANAAFLA